MSTLKSSAEDLTLNADGSGNDIKFQSNGVEKASIDQDGNLVLSGTLTSAGIDDNADATAITINSTEQVGIGTGSPTGNAKVHIYNGASGQAEASNNTELTIENSGTTGIQFLTPNTAVSGLWFGDPENKEVGRMYYVHSDNSFKFFTNASERLRIDSEGIKFNADTAAANALDDYEEGTHAYTITGATSGSMTVRNGYGHWAYTKIGRLVTVQGRWETLGTHNAVGALKFSLPFAAHSGLSQSAVARGDCSVYRAGDNFNNVGAVVYDSGSVFYLKYNQGGTGDSDASVEGGDVDSSTEGQLSITYMTA